MSVIKICQLFEWKSATGAVFLCQNFFIGEDFKYAGKVYRFVPFQVSGSVMMLGGDNDVLTVLLPNEDIVLQIVSAGDGNRNSQLTLTQLWLNQSNQPLPGSFPESYIGQGASFDDVTVELRFRSAMDAVGSTIPYRTLTSENSGILPLDSQIRLQ